MKRLVVILVAALSTAVGADGYARPRHHHRHHSVAHVAHRAAVHSERAVEKARATKHRARRRARTHDALRSSYSDELALSPALLRQVQRNLVDGGYYRGTVDGRLTLATRHALVDFQHEYHLGATGRLDRPTAEALLGRDAVASAAPPARG
jgi:hypothetical protein